VGFLFWEQAFGTGDGPMGEIKETKAQRIERFKHSKNAWEHFDEIREFARKGYA
jgi:hypothetical protein